MTLKMKTGSSPAKHPKNKIFMRKLFIGIFTVINLVSAVIVFLMMINFLSENWNVERTYEKDFLISGMILTFGFNSIVAYLGFKEFNKK